MGRQDPIKFNQSLQCIPYTHECLGLPLTAAACPAYTRRIARWGRHSAVQHAGDIHGRRKGLDFVFDKPVNYARPQSVFYPLVACTDKGIVIAGQNWDVSANPDGSFGKVFERLFHISWSGKVCTRRIFSLEKLFKMD